MNEARREDGPRGADRVAVGDGAAFDVDDLLRQAKFARDDNDDRRKGLVDFDTLHRADIPAGATKGLPHSRGHRA